LEYQRLRAEYGAAFSRLCEEVCRLRSITQQVSPDKTAEEAARWRVHQALGVYRECRNRLAECLTPDVQVLPRSPWEEAGRPAVNPDENWYRAEELPFTRQ
jgi:hypothetical protein